MRSVARCLSVCALLTLAGCGGSTPAPPPPPVPVFTAQAGYPRMAAEIVDWMLARDPVHATSIGEHAYDTTLGSHFPGDLERARRDARALLTRLTAVNRPTLALADALDHRVLEYGLRRRLLELEQIGTWQRDPALYVDIAAGGTLGLLDPDVGLEPAGAARALGARWRDAPGLFRAARQNLDRDRVPVLFARRATERAAELAAWFDGERPPHWRAALESQPATVQAMRVAEASVDSFAAWIADLAPTTTGGFRIGSDALRQLILYSRHVDLTLAEIDALNRQALRDYREWMERVALEMDPMRPPAAIIDSMLAARENEWRVLPPLMMLGTNERSVSRVRLAIPPAGLNEAWTHFMDLAAVESEAAASADRLAAIRRALHAHALLNATIQLHAGNTSLEEAALQLQSQAFLPREAARIEAERIAHDPGYGLIALDRMQMMALRASMRAQHAGAFDERRFAQELLDLQLPVPLAAEAMLGHEPGSLLVVGRRTPGVPEAPRLLSPDGAPGPR